MVAGVPSRLLPPWLDTEIARDAGVDGALGVVDPGHALEHERPAPLLAQPGHVVPARAAASASTRRRRRRTSGPSAPGAPCSAWSGRASCPVLAKRQEPARVGQRLGGEPEHGPAGSPSRGSSGCPSRARGRRTSRAWRSARPRRRRAPARPAARICVPRADPVDLEEGLRVGGDHVLDRLAGERAEPHGGARGPPRPGPPPPRRRGARPGRRSGEIMTGNEMSWPMTVVARSRLAGQPGHVRGEAELAVGGDVVLDA